MIHENNKVILFSYIRLAGYSGPGQYFEPTSYGVPNSQWQLMSQKEQEKTKYGYREDEKLRVKRERLSVEQERLETEKKRLRVGQERLDRGR